MISKFKQFKKLQKNKGSLLLELLIAISLFAIIFVTASNALFLSMRSNKTSGEKDVANSLAAEEIEAVRAITDENWNNLYGTTKSSQRYYASSTVSPGKWTISTGEEQVSMNGISYARYFIVNNVCRDDLTREIKDCGAGSSDDPSTQQVTVIVSWGAGVTDSVSASEYFFRWKNKICNQTDWATGGSGDEIKDCSDAFYDTKDDEIEIINGSIQLK